MRRPWKSFSCGQKNPKSTSICSKASPASSSLLSLPLSSAPLGNSSLSSEELSEAAGSDPEASGSSLSLLGGACCLRLGILLLRDGGRFMMMEVVQSQADRRPAGGQAERRRELAPSATRPCMTLVKAGMLGAHAPRHVTTLMCLAPAQQNNSSKGGRKQQGSRNLEG